MKVKFIKKELIVNENKVKEPYRPSTGTFIYPYIKRNKHNAQTRREQSLVCLHPRDHSLIQIHTHDNTMSFEPSKSSCSAEKIQEFLELQASEISIQDVPGVGPAFARDVKDKKEVTTCAQLLGQFLLFVAADTDTTEVCQKFYDWCKSVNGNANAHSITFSIASYAEKKGLFNYEL